MAAMHSQYPTPLIRVSCRLLLGALAFLLCGPMAQAVAGTVSNDRFLSPEQAFSYQQTTTPDGQIALNWDIADRYYLYRSRLTVKGVDATVAQVDKPEGKLIHDPYFGDEYIYRDGVTVTVDPGDAKRLKLTWQGCAKAGLCYPPQHATIKIAATGGSPTAQPAQSSAPSGPQPRSSSAADPSATSSAPAASDQALAARLAGGHIAWALLVFFGLGLLLAFTPCVLPMVPILSGVIVGAGARGLRGFTLSLAFVLPMALTYAALGVAAALAGANLQAALQTPAVLGVFASVFVILALAMFGIFELQLPAPVRERLTRASANRTGGHLAGAAVLGVISAVLVGPCMTAPLAGALLYLANSGNVVLGGLALLFLGLGMGVPLLVVGTLGAQFMPKPGAWMDAVKAAFGFILLATALWMIGRVTPDAIMLGLWGALLLAVGVTLWQTARRGAAALGARTMIAATAGLLIGLWGGLMVVGAAGGAQDPWRPLGFLNAPGSSSVAANETSSFNDRFQTIHDLEGLKQATTSAAQNGQWTVVDFYADWCVSCQVIDKTVFGNPQVQKALANAKLLRPDVTDDDAASRRLMHAVGIMGPPTILFIGPNGKERRSARVVGELSAEAFLEHWRHAHATSGGPTIEDHS